MTEQTWLKTRLSELERPISGKYRSLKVPIVLPQIPPFYLSPHRATSARRRYFDEDYTEARTEFLEKLELVDSGFRNNEPIMDVSTDSSLWEDPLRC